MTISIELSDEILERLRTEAELRGMTVESLVEDMVASSVPTPAPKRTHRLGFVGIASSGRTEAIDIHREREALAAEKATDGI